MHSLSICIQSLSGYSSHCLVVRIQSNSLLEPIIRTRGAPLRPVPVASYLVPVLLYLGPGIVSNPTVPFQNLMTDFSFKLGNRTTIIPTGCIAGTVNRLEATPVGIVGGEQQKRFIEFIVEENGVPGTFLNTIQVPLGAD